MWNLAFHEIKKLMCRRATEFGLAATLLIVRVRTDMFEDECVFRVNCHNPFTAGTVMFVHVENRFE